MKNLLAVVCAGLSLMGFSATTWKVNHASGNDTLAAADPTGAMAFRNIQPAVDNAASGDTILVDPGVYDEDGAYTTEACGARCRLWIDKKIILTATGNRDNTFIVGAHDPNGFRGCGPQSVRCIVVTSNGNLTLTGFTVKDGSVNLDSTLAADARQTAGIRNVTWARCYAYDCAVENCVAFQAAAGFTVGFYRTYFRNNAVVCTNGWGCASATRDCMQVFCVFSGHRGFISGKGTGSPTVVHYPRATINCTFFNNQVNVNGGGNAGTSYPMKNCVVDQRVATGSAVPYYNCSVTDEGMVSASATKEDCVFGLPIAGLASTCDGSGFLRNDMTSLKGIASALLLTNTVSKMWTKDIDGQPVDLDNLHPGAHQTFRTLPGVSGALAFTVPVPTKDNQNGNALVFDGNYLVPGYTNWHYDVCWPTQHVLNAVFDKEAGRRSLGVRMKLIKDSDTWQDYQARVLPHDTNDVGLVTTPPPGQTNVWQLSVNANVYWVDAAASDGGTGTEASPFNTLQGAFAKIGTGSGTILVKPGVYDKGEGDSPLGGGRCRAEIKGSYNTIRLIGLGGAEKTFIVGASDPDAAAEAKGCGPNAVRLFEVNSSKTSAFHLFVQGFTLCGGRSLLGAKADTGNGYQSIIRGAVNNTHGLVFTDCIISNNVGSYYGLGRSMVCTRCVITENESLTGALILWGAVNSSIVTNNVSPLAGDNTTVSHTTFDESMTSSSCSVKVEMSNNPSIQNSIVIATTAPYTTSGLNNGNVLWGCAIKDSSHGNLDNTDPELVGNGDWRVYSSSPAVNNAIHQPSVPSSWWMRDGGDFFGKRWTFNADGKTVAGAVNETAFAISGAATGGRGISPTGRQVPDAQGRVTFTATETATRNFLGFDLNGTLVQPASEGTTYTYQLPDPRPTVGQVVTALYSTNWYANASAPDDAASGADAAHPKRTLSAALKYAIPGDVVHAAEGVYNEGSDLYDLNHAHDKNATAVTIRTRAVVPEGVTLQADGPQATTVIEGAAATHDADALGNGPDAIRCVHLSTNSCVRGFTIRNGHTGVADNPVSNLTLDDRTAGGVNFQRTTYSAKVTDCVITNCTATRCVAGYGGTWIRCAFVDNALTADFGGIVRGAFLGGCLFKGNRGTPLVYYCQGMGSTTFVGDNVRCDGTTPAQCIATCYNRTIDNCLFAIKYVCNSDSLYTFRDCAFLKTGSTHTNNVNNVFSGVCIEDDRVAILDDRGAPKPLENPAVDAGNAARWTYGDTDAWGGMRVYNGAIDVGAVEADWRSVYAKFLRKSRLTVDAASSNVTATVAEGVVTGVVLPTGASLEMTFAARGNETLFRAPVTLASGATLTVSRNGGEGTVVTHSGEVELTVDAAVPTSFTFTAAGGDVTLAPILSTAGLSVILR